jgi:hypothetical protein
MHSIEKYQLNGVGFTSIQRVSILGKHLRKLGSISTALQTPKCSFNASVWTVETMFPGLAFVPAYSQQTGQNWHLR